MKILYVTSLWTAFKNMLLTDGDDSKGMPAFILPLIEMKRRGFDIGFIFISDEISDREILTMDYKTKLFHRSEVKGIVINEAGRGPKRILNQCRTLNKVYNATCQALYSEKYDFVYSHGAYAASAACAASRYGIPSGQRQYGTFLWKTYQEMNHRFLRAGASLFPEVLSYNIKKSFLLMTNDGTQGDLAFKKYSLLKNRVPFYFWVNGVERHNEIENNIEGRTIEKYDIRKPSVFYLARVVRWKRQDRAIQVIGELKKRGIEVELYIAGQILEKDKEWLDELRNLADNLNVSDLVHYVGATSRLENAVFAKNCIASMVMYDPGCLGNVFHELMADGAIVICQDDNKTTGDFLLDGENGFLVNSSSDAADIIMELLKDKKLDQGIRDKAVRYSKNNVKTWKERIDDEIKLIESVVRR